MGTVRLCVHELAKTPFWMETTGIHIFSIEELAYYLYENIYLIDERMIDEKLYDWIERELGMKSLAERLQKGRSTGTHVYNQVMNILQASEYYTEKELNDLSEKIKTISGMQEQERMKYKGDELAQNKNYWGAINEYEKLLSIRQNSKLSMEFYGNVWNNLAACYGKLFLFEKAASCYENAYQYQKNSEYRERAYYARKLAFYGEEWAEELLENKISEEFLKQADKVLEELEEASRQECSSLNCQEFLQQRM